MGMQLPGELVSVLGALGINWPESDEEKLFNLGQTWMNFSSKLSEVGGNSTKAAEKVWDGHIGPAVEAFTKKWEEFGGTKNLDIAKTAGTVMGGGLFIYAGVVLALKIAAIVQLVILAVQIAQAIATAVPTFGASLLQIPIFRQITKTIIENLMSTAVMEIIGKAVD